MIINHNISALNTYNKLSTNENAAAASLEKLSSGLRINKAADDASGLAISQKMQAQINGLNQASSNAQDGISLIQTAEGGMSQIQSILQRMNELATESANGTQDGNSGTDRSALDGEFSALTAEIGRIASSTTFNGQNLLDGSASSITLQVGATANTTDQIKIGVDSMALTGTALSGISTLSITAQTGAQSAISAVQAAIDNVSTARASLGAYQNRLNYTISNLSTESQNLQSASSQITDVDMAKEMTEYTKNNILTQAANAMLAQANQLPQSVLTLLKS